MIIYLDTDEVYSGNMIASGFAFDSTANFQVGNTVIYGLVTKTRWGDVKETTPYKDCKKHGILTHLCADNSWSECEYFRNIRASYREYEPDGMLTVHFNYDSSGILHGHSFYRKNCDEYYWYKTYDHGDIITGHSRSSDCMTLMDCIGILPPECTSIYRPP